MNILTVHKYFNKTRALWYLADNWGDALNPFLISALSGKRVLYYSNARFTKYLCVGSICNMLDAKTIIWGAGCIKREETFQCRPLKVCAVRGPLTRQVLEEHGIDAPEIYGDPALLMPLLYKPKRTHDYKIGVIPHYVDKDNPWVQKVKDCENVSLIDVQSSVREFVDKVSSCELVLSSSLHGNICADAYGVPSLWIQLSDKVYGENFKFMDYMLSVGRSQLDPVVVDDRMTLNDVLSWFEKYVIKYSYRDLYLSCPFRNRSKWPDSLLDEVKT